MIVGRAGRCPRCDVVHGAGARFCGSCGLDFTSAEAAGLDASRRLEGGRARRERDRKSAAAMATIAGLVWLIVGSVTVVGAIVELSGGGRTGTWAAISAVLELLTGAALFVSPSWEMLTAAMLWGILSVLGTVYAIAFGPSPGATGLVIAAGICLATVLSWLGRRPLPVPAGLGRSRGGEGTRADETSRDSKPDATAGRR